MVISVTVTVNLNHTAVRYTLWIGTVSPRQFETNPFTADAVKALHFAMLV